jgi:moderate conductance mechanosensitive channel
MEQWISVEFWKTVLAKITDWLVESLPILLLILILAVVGLKLVDLILTRIRRLMVRQMKTIDEGELIEQGKRLDTLMDILRSVLRITLWVIVVMMVLKKLGVDIAPLIAGAGIAGLAVGFGAQELVRDMISGFFILMENQIRTGDVAIINGTPGLVQHVGLRTLVLRDNSGVVHVFQNGKIDTLSNMTKEWSAMVFDIGVAYKEDVDQVIETMKEVGSDLQSDPEFGHHILEPLEVLGLDSFADSAVVIKARLKTVPIQQWATGREYRRRLKKAFDLKGIEIPFPHRTVYFGNSSPNNGASLQKP